MNRDALYLDRIRDAIGKIERFTAGIDEVSFATDEKTQSAVILQLILIGEMAKRVSEETRAKIAIPWKEITGFRDRAIHDYFDMDLDVIWQTTRSDVPELKERLAKD